jgi:hypothetical protein
MLFLSIQTVHWVHIKQSNIKLWSQWTSILIPFATVAWIKINLFFIGFNLVYNNLLLSSIKWDRIKSVLAVSAMRLLAHLHWLWFSNITYFIIISKLTYHFFFYYIVRYHFIRFRDILFKIHILWHNIRWLIIA